METLEVAVVVLVHLRQDSRAGRGAERNGGVVERAGGVKSSAIGGLWSKSETSAAEGSDVTNHFDKGKYTRVKSAV